MLTKKKHRNKQTAWRRLSISQGDLAQYLGISVSLLSMYDKSLRQLPSKASLKLTRLEDDYRKAATAKIMSRSLAALQPVFQEQLEKAAQKMMEKLEDQRYLKKQLVDKLNEMTEKEEQDKIWLNVLANKLETLSPEEVSANDGRHLDHLHEKIVQRLKKTNKEKLKLQLEIELLEAGVGVYEAQHLKLKKRE